MNGLEIGKAIKTVLNGTTKVYPLVADQGASYPFIVYRRSGLTHANTKDRFNYQELATVEVIVAGSTYQQALQIAKEVLGRMEHTRGMYENISISEIKLINAEEDYIEDAFIQKLTFNIEIL